MARRRASMREGPLAELFRATEAAQRQAEKEGREPEPEAQQQAEAASRAGGAGAAAGTDDPERVEPPEKTVEHVPEWEEAAPPPPPPPPPEPVRLPERAPEPKREAPKPKLEPLPEPPPRLHRVPEPGAYIAVIRVVGVGGAGLNAVNRMIDADISQVEFVAVNTDIQQLQTSDAPVKIHIGRELTEGLGSGADPDLGRRAAEEAYDQIKRALRGSDMVFVTAGEGGGTGSGAAPVVARIAQGARRADGRHRHDAVHVRGHAPRASRPTDGVDTLRANCDTVIVVPNEKLLEVLDRETSMLDAFRIADDVLRQGVQGICDLITLPGLINLDFADVRTIMKDAGTALMGIGFSATGENRAREAAERALRSPLIETDVGGAKGILLSIAGGDDLSLYEVNEAAEVVRGAATDDTNIIFGATVDDRLTGQVWVTVVATGFGSARGASGGSRCEPRRRTRTRSSHRASCRASCRAHSSSRTSSRVEAGDARRCRAGAGLPRTAPVYIGSYGVSDRIGERVHDLRQRAAVRADVPHRSPAGSGSVAGSSRAPRRSSSRTTRARSAWPARCPSSRSCSGCRPPRGSPGASSSVRASGTRCERQCGRRHVAARRDRRRMRGAARASRIAS